jgi:hypothetical protein
VVGGGPAGLEAARVCAERGHSVVLFEKSTELGGQIRLAARATWREALSGIPRWLVGQVRRLGVDVRLGVEASAALVLSENPDVVVVATGGTPARGDIPGAELALSLWDVLEGPAPPPGDASSVLLYDELGQHNAASVAETLARSGWQVELATHDRMIAQEVGTTNQPVHLRELFKLGVVLSPHLELTQIYREGNRLVSVLRNTMTEAEEERVVDRVVAEFGTVPVDGVYFDLKPRAVNRGQTDLPALLAGRRQPWPLGIELYRIGDAVAGRNIHAALFDALRLCKDF